MPEVKGESNIQEVENRSEMVSGNKPSACIEISEGLEPVKQKMVRAFAVVGGCVR